jgi:hypothetical protein
MMWELLGRLLGLPFPPSMEQQSATCENTKDIPKLKLVSSHDMGIHVHIFSHIRCGGKGLHDTSLVTPNIFHAFDLMLCRQTTHVEKVVVMVDDMEGFKRCVENNVALGLAVKSVHDEIEEQENLDDRVAGGHKPSKGRGGKSKNSARNKCEGEDETKSPVEIRWICKAEMSEAGLSTLTRKIYDLASGEKAGKKTK